jgi:hypothetical protein
MCRRIILILCGVSFLGLTAMGDDTAVRKWTHYVRIGAYGLNSGNVEHIVRDAQDHHVFGIEVDNDIPGRYESFLDPSAKLSAIHKLAVAAHAANNKAFVYIAGTECITAHADSAVHSVMKDHPDWLQRKITGEPAMFKAGSAFWISPGDEDVWISPYAPAWRKTYMERVRQIATTGIDGIYVDIPYWMTHFDGWENTWASFDDYTVAAFRQSTGLDARHDVPIGDFSNANFRKWMDFRIDTLTAFMREIRENARSVNPAILVIPEIYPGIEEESPRVGADVYEMYPVVDAIAHEYEFGSGEHMASSRSEFDWFLYQVGMLSFRAFAEGRATWILNYSWDGDKGVDPREAMKTLAMSQLAVGANFWDAPGHSMAGSNDAETRSAIFAWIAKNQNTFYDARVPMHPVGVYFSPKSRDYDASTFLPSYRGILLILLQSHWETQVVTPRTLAQFKGEALVLPSVSVLSDEEKALLRSFVERGGRLVVTGENQSGLPGGNSVREFPKCPGPAHFEATRKDFAQTPLESAAAFLGAVRTSADLRIDASPNVVAYTAMVSGQPHVFLANFGGVHPGKNVVPTLERDVRIHVSTSAKYRMKFLPFLGEVQTLTASHSAKDQEFVLPPIERGAVAWLEPDH